MLRPVLSEPGVQVAGVRVRVDAGAVEVPVPAEAEVRVDVPDATTSSMTVEITQVGGSASTRWALGDRRARGRGPPGRPPRTLRRLAGGLSGPTGRGSTPPRSTWS